jgi:bifunctional DNA-binding transcriptional regulator/antitoxin component of YhaV-PrlF toxin-antitoxin module
MNKTYSCKVEVDEKGEYFITIPEDILSSLGINSNTLLSLVCNDDGSLILKKKTDWTLDQLQEGDMFEMVVEDVAKNNTLHYILDKGKTFVLAPIMEDVQELYKKINLIGS